jgi:putative DNA primase/helicase
MCGGTDRFQYTDKFGEGNYHCRGCGPGGGFKLLQGYHGWDFGTAFKRVGECVGSVGVEPRPQPGEPSAQRKRALAKRLWEEAKPISTGDDVDRYLRNRGLQLFEYPKTLRCHPALGYYEKDASGKSRKVGEYPAMLACIQGTDGHAVTLHRTYLKDGKKALGRESKRILSGGISGAAVRLFEPRKSLAIAEGIETALAVRHISGRPVWAALSAGNMERLWVPETVRSISIYADNDAHSEYRGQTSAFVLAGRLKKEGLKPARRRVEVFVPEIAGADWGDVWLRRVLRSAKKAA